MNRIVDCLDKIKSRGGKALATYIVGGDPNPEVTLAAMQAIVAAGADILEIGVPFSDPMAEGPVIQLGHERALANRFSLRQCIELVRKFRETDQTTPVVLMGYANPVERMGYEAFAKNAAAAGVDGVLTVDLPPEEATDVIQLFRAQGLETIFLLAPTSSDERTGRVAAMAGGFIYYVSLKGVTGAGHLDVAAVAQRVDFIRSTCTLPVLVGFGIKDAESAAAVARCADGVVVGSALVELMGSGKPLPDVVDALTDKVSSIRAALNNLR